MPTIRDIAEKLNISSGTVSKGLNGGSDISENLRRQILETAVEMGYSTKKSRKPGNRSVALFLENMSDESPEIFGFDLALGFRQAAYKEGWNVDVKRIDPKFQNAHPYSTYILEKGYSAAYLCGLALEDPWMEQLSNTGVPTVLLDNFIEDNPHVACVSTDNSESMDLMFRHLISMGHEKIAFLDGSAHSFVSDDRMRAYLECMRKYHLPINPNFAVYGYFVADAARYHVPAFLDLGATAIICGSDDIAAGVISCVQSMGLSVPEDISVIGFDDLPIAETLTPALSTIRQNRLSLGKCGIYLINAMLDDCCVSSITLRPELILRASTEKAKPRLAVRRVEEKDSVLYLNPQLYAQFV